MRVVASKEFDEIKIFGPVNGVSKLTFEVCGTEPAFFEGHWWKKWDYEDASVYLSSHSGCPVGCKMCGTNRYYVRQASVRELIEQFEFMHRKMFPHKDEQNDYKKLVCKFLYMGEPLLNLANVDAALRYIATSYPNWEILVSTTAPRLECNYRTIKNWIRDFGERILVSFSVHKLDENERNALIPFKDKLSIEEIKSLGIELHRVNKKSKISFSYNLFNREGSYELAQMMLNAFPADVWIPCIQYLYDKSGREAPEYEASCNEQIDRFLGLLYQIGYEEAYGFYAPESSGDSHLVTGCGQFVEFQDYTRKKKLERTI